MVTGKRATIIEVDKDTVYIMCPKCKGEGSQLKPSGGILVHKLCQICNGKGGQNVPKKVLDYIIAQRKE